MDEKQQLNVMVSPALRQRLRDVADRRQCPQGDVVEDALRAYLDGAQGEGQLGAYGALATQLEAMATDMDQVVRVLDTLIAILETQQAQAETAPAIEMPQIATYEQLYGPLPEPDEPAWVQSPLPRPQSRWYKWLCKE